jgi:Flp pilus assembly protein TadB
MEAIIMGQKKRKKKRNKNIKSKKKKSNLQNIVKSEKTQNIVKSEKTDKYEPKTIERYMFLGIFFSATIMLIVYLIGLIMFLIK